MAGLLIVAHAPLASTLKAVAAHVFPGESRLAALDVASDASPETLATVARELAAQVRDPDLLVLTDAFGGTPCNVALKLADDAQVRVVAGVNVPMLWRALGYRHLPLNELTERAVAGGIQGVMQLPTTRPEG
ncbi:MAG: PTS fructose transporter subunit IIA [Burkholderiaceae bacterium]